jgi:hypothetical protein
VNGNGRNSPAAQRALRTELACARALLDALETALDAETEERTKCGVALQIAEQFVRVANTMTLWGDAWSQNGISELRQVDSFKLAPPSRLTDGARARRHDAILIGPKGRTEEHAGERARGIARVLTSLASRRKKARTQ